MWRAKRLRLGPRSPGLHTGLKKLWLQIFQIFENRYVEIGCDLGSLHLFYGHVNGSPTCWGPARSLRPDICIPSGVFTLVSSFIFSC